METIIEKNVRAVKVGDIVIDDEGARMVVKSSKEDREGLMLWCEYVDGRGARWWMRDTCKVVSTSAVQDSSPLSDLMNACTAAAGESAL